jgi:hypothetical protein
MDTYGLALVHGELSMLAACHEADLVSL